MTTGRHVSRHVTENGSGTALSRLSCLLTGLLIAGALIAIGPRLAWAHVRPTGSVARAARATTETFNGVAATSPADAWIVGTSQSGRSPVHTLIARWNGRSWHRVPSLDAAGRRTSSFLNAVAATSPGNAWAVGESNIAGGSTLIERWNGTAWKIVPSPSVSRHFNVLSSVAATSRNDAWAVGWVFTRPGTRTLIEHWNGTRWRRVPSPNVGNLDQNSLSSVTAISPADAWAVGEHSAGSNPPQTLIEHWNGTKWAIVPSPNPLNASPDHLNGVAAISPADIFAVGDLGDVAEPTQTMIFRWQGIKWRNVPSPGNPSAVESLSAVSAVSASHAWAVGSFESQTDSPNLTLILRWNGSKWRNVRAPFPRGADLDSLVSVAAPSAKAAWAVGATEGGPHQGPLLLHWNGTRWAIAAISLR